MISNTERAAALMHQFDSADNKDERNGYLREAAKLGHRAAIAWCSALFEYDYPAAYAILFNEMTKGCVWSTYLLGYLLENDEAGVDPEWSMLLFTSASDSGHVGAMVRLGSCHYKGKGTPVNYGKAAALWHKAAAKGHAMAKFNLATCCYGEGHGVAKDFRKAIELLKEAAAEGCSQSTYYIGYCYKFGEMGLKQNSARAVPFLEKAAAAGDIEAIATLGTSCLEGDGLPADVQRAVALYNKACAAGFVPAKCVFAECLATGHRIKRNADIAADILLDDVPFQDAAPFMALIPGPVLIAARIRRENGAEMLPWLVGDEARLSGELRQTAIELMDGLDSYTLPQLKVALARMDQGRKCASTATQVECALAAQALRTRIDKLEGRIEDPKVTDLKETYNLLNDVAKRLQYDAPSLVKLGARFEEGRGIRKDLVEAARLYSRASKQGSVEGRFNLAVCYETGSGVTQDKRKAAELYGLGVKAGDINSMNNLGVCYEEGIGVKVDTEKAVALYTEASKHGDADAKFNLGECFENGVGVEKDLAKALALYKEAAAKGNDEAAEKVRELQ